MSGQLDVKGSLKKNDVVQEVGGVLKNIRDGSIITGLSAVPWAKFIVDSSDPTIGVDPTILCNYMISDKQVYPGGCSPIFLVDPLRAGNKRFLQSPHLYIASYADRPSAVDFPLMTLMLGEFGNCLSISDGTDWVSKNTQTVYQEQNGTLTTPTKSTPASSTGYTFTTGMPDIPANLIVPGKTIMRCQYSMRRRGANGTNDFAIRLGTVGNNSDPVVTYYSAIAATDLRDVRNSTKLTFPTSAFLISTRAQGDTINGTNGLTESSGTQWDITQPLKITVAVPTKNAADTIDLIDMRLIWER